MKASGHNNGTNNTYTPRNKDRFLPSVVVCEYGDDYVSNQSTNVGAATDDIDSERIVA
jgi:hypothetical protein